MQLNVIYYMLLIMIETLNAIEIKLNDSILSINK